MVGIKSKKKNPIFNMASKSGTQENKYTGRKLGYYLGNKLGMGSIKPSKNFIENLFGNLKKY